MSKLFRLLVGCCVGGLVSCSTPTQGFRGFRGYGRMSPQSAPKVINVSSYDPKEAQRSGSRFNEHNVTALRRNGAVGLIARAGKGRLLDDKCGAFLASGRRAGMNIGTYYFCLKGVNPVWQADQYVARLQSLSASYGLRGVPILLCADIDSKLTANEAVAFVSRIRQRTGVTPVIYLENSATLRRTLSHASSSQKSVLRAHPYWLALYSHTGGFQTPADLMRAYGVWRGWAMWQYAGVQWKNGHSRQQTFSHGGFRAPKYFGNLAMPSEQNAFNGNLDDLERFWKNHSWIVR